MNDLNCPWVKFEVAQRQNPKEITLVQAKLIYFVEITNGPRYSGDIRRVSLNFLSQS